MPPFLSLMASVYIYTSSSDLTAPAVSIAPSDINIYSNYSDYFWAGLGQFGESLDARFDGYNLYGSNPVITKFALYYNQVEQISVEGLSLSSSNAGNILAGGFLSLLGGNDSISALSGTHTLVGGAGADEIYAFDGGNDNIHGMHGADYIYAAGGDDIIRGGHGPDELIGGTGSDWIWGGVGANTAWLGDLFEDGSPDQVFVPVDSVRNQYGNPGGINRDAILGAETIDRIYLHGVADSALTFAAGVSDPRGAYSDLGVGIYANGTLEALVYGNLSVDQVAAITTGGFFA